MEQGATEEDPFAGIAEQGVRMPQKMTMAQSGQRTLSLLLMGIGGVFIAGFFLGSFMLYAHFREGLGSFEMTLLTGLIGLGILVLSAFLRKRRGKTISRFLHAAIFAMALAVCGIFYVGLEIRELGTDLLFPAGTIVVGQPDFVCAIWDMDFT